MKQPNLTDKPIPVALLVRVSSKHQDYERQVSDLTKVCERENWQIAEIISSKISGSKVGREFRKDIDRLMELCQSGKVKKVLICEVSRLGRRPAENYQLLEHLSEMGVSIYAHNYGMETLLATGKRNPAASLIFLIFNEQARTEVELLSERIVSGQNEARKKGKNIGRPFNTHKSQEQLFIQYPQVVKYLKQNELSIRQIAKLCDVVPNTVMKVKRNLLP